jgi:hypothetical protein
MMGMMAMRRLSGLERETIILFNEAEAVAEIEAHSPAMRKRLAAMLRERPEEISLLRSGECSDCYAFPKGWVKIAPPRKATEKQREHLASARAKVRE